MSVEVISVDDWVSYIKNEKMDEIWLEVERDGVSVFSLYGRDGDKYYFGCGYRWEPIYVSTYEDFLKRIEERSVFYRGSILVKIK